MLRSVLTDPIHHASGGVVSSRKGGGKRPPILTATTRAATFGTENTPGAQRSELDDSVDAWVDSDHASLWEALGAAPDVTPRTPFASERFEVLEAIGSGGMGVVYAALDRVAGRRVAVKTLRKLDPDALLRFKREFRLLQDIHHPNLVRLGELIEERRALVLHHGARRRRGLPRLGPRRTNA